MICKKCGRELVQGTRFCTGCGAVVEQNCPNCGSTINDGMKFCVQCGFSFEQNAAYTGANQGFGGNAQVAMGESDRGQKLQKMMGILNTVIGALVVFSVFLMDDIEADLSWILLLCGIGILVVGILQLANRSEKAIHINQIVFGALAALIGLSDFSGIVAGCPLLIVGILGLLRKSLKASAIIEIVFGGILVLFGFFDWFWVDFLEFGLLLLGAAELTSGILRLTNLKYIKL